MADHPELKKIIQGFVFSASFLGLTALVYTICFRHAAGGAIAPIDVKIPALDDMIPVIPVMFFGYIWSYIYWFFAPFFILKTGKRHVREFVITYACTLIISGLILYFLPTANDRVAAGLWDLTKNDFGSKLLRMCYNLDGRETEYCLLPSLHCANCVLYHQGMQSEKIPRGFRLAALFSTRLVAVSALCIKQHYVVDVLAGFLLPMLVHRIVVSAEI